MSRLPKLARQVEDSIFKLEQKREQQLTALLKTVTKLAGLRRKQNRYERAIGKLAGQEEAPAPKPAPKSLQEQVAEVMAEPAPTTPKPDDDLGIPTFLQRPYKLNPYAAEQKEMKDRKKKEYAEKRKGVLAERKALGKIAKSKQRWDTSKCQWVEG